ncbi:hypothetical protein [Streptomyces sp. NPDC057877]
MSSAWKVVCAIATIVLGPPTATASALAQANAAPLRQPPKLTP